jgi:hypothetical protein
LKTISKQGLLATSLILLTGCGPQENSGGPSDLNIFYDILNSTPAQRESARQAEAAAEAASFQNTLLILLLVVAVGILIVVLGNKSSGLASDSHTKSSANPQKENGTEKSPRNLKLDSNMRLVCKTCGNWELIENGRCTACN